MPSYGRGGGGGGAGGPAPNTILWTTAFADRHADTHVLVIPRITADDASDPSRKVPIVTDRVTIGSRSAVIVGVEQPTGREFTTLALDEEIGVEVAEGDLIRIDRLLYGDVDTGTADGAVSGPVGQAQARVDIAGAGGANFRLTLKTPYNGMEGANGNGVRFTLTVDPDRSTSFYYSPSSRHGILYVAARPNLDQLRTLLLENASSYFNIGNRNGGANQAVPLSEWVFANGTTVTAGGAEVDLHDVREGIKVGDSIVFQDTAGDPRHEITSVTHDAAKTTLGFTPPIAAAYANDGNLLIERPVGYFEAVASAAGRPGPPGPPGIIDGAASARSRIGFVDSAEIAAAAPLRIPLTEPITANNNYRIVVIDDASGMRTTIFDDSGEAILAVDSLDAAPTTYLNAMIDSILATRFDTAGVLTSNAVSRWNTLRGENDSELYILDVNGSDRATTVEVWKYPRTGSRGPAGSGVSARTYYSMGDADRFANISAKAQAPIVNAGDQDGARIRLRYNNVADESVGNPEFDVAWSTSAQAEASNIDQTPIGAEVVPSNHIFTISTPGLYRISSVLTLNTTYRARMWLGLFQIEAATDDVFAAWSVERQDQQRAVSPFPAGIEHAVRVTSELIEVGGDGASFYTLFSPGAEREVRLGGYLTIEKAG